MADEIENSHLLPFLMNLTFQGILFSRARWADTSTYVLLVRFTRTY